MHIPNCITIANTYHKNCYQYPGLSLIDLINKSVLKHCIVLSLKTNLPIVPLRLFLTVPAFNVPGVILCIVKFIDARGTVKRHVLQKIYNLRVMKSTDQSSQPLTKVPSRTYWNISRSFMAKCTLRKRENSCSTKDFLLEIAFFCLCTIIIFSSLNVNIYLHLTDSLQ